MTVIRTCSAALVSTIILLGLATAAPLHAQDVIDATEEISFDRPEAWAMKWFASITQFTAVGPPRHREPWQLEIGLELGWVPSLSEEERRVGFNGTKVEDMNRVDVMPRPRLAVGLPGDLTLELAWVPPIEVEGVTPNLLAVAVERPVFDRQRLILGLRAYGQLGGTEGDYTCSEHDASYPPGSEDNPFGCEAPSSDTATLDTLGFGLTGGYRIGGDRGATLHFAAFANYMDLEFQVDALTYGLRDRTRLVTDGWTWSVVAGAELPLGSSTSLSLEGFYSPLDVRRDPTSDVTENDALLNARAMVRYLLP